MLAFLPNQLRRSTRSLRGSATTSSRKTEKFRVNPFAKVLLCTTSLLPAIVVLPPAIFAQGVDPNTVYARAFAVSAAEPYIKQGFHVREDYWPGDLAPGERKSIMQRCPFIFIIRTENSRNNQTVGRKTTLRLRTSFQKPQALTLSSLAWRNRQQPTRIGRWGMVSDKVDLRTLSDGSKAYRSSDLNIVVTYIDGVSQSET